MIPMRKIILLAITVIGFFLISSAIFKEQDFHVKIEQDGKIIKPINNEVTLKKKEFALVFEFPEFMGVLISASFNDKTFKPASKNKPKIKLPGFANTGMAEGMLNSEKDIMIADDAPSFWFYEDDANHRFNEVIKERGNFTCKRIIQKYYIVADQTSIKVEESKDPLYLVFISYKVDGIKEVELKREYVKINWEN